MKKSIGALILLSAVLLVSSAAAQTCKKPQDHQYGEWQTVVEPGCIKSGRREAVCEVCGYAKKEMLAVLGHEWGELTTKKAPTCTKEGVGERVCLRCNQAKQVKLGKIEHTWGEWSIKSKPEAGKQGIRESVCSVCSVKHSEAFYLDGTLYEGMKPCSEVTYLQLMLSDLGYYEGSVGGGQYGELTTSAVAHFQRSVLLEGSGVADPQTQSALKIIWEKQTGKTIEDLQDFEKTQNAA